jgi:hypothetical protein
MTTEATGTVVAMAPVTMIDGRLGAVAEALRKAAFSIQGSINATCSEETADTLRTVADALFVAADEVKAAGTVTL